MLGKRLIIALLILVNLFFLYRILLTDQGLFAYLKLKSARQELAGSIADTDQDSLRLSREIRWLKSDPAYQERTIRGQMNFLRDNEVLYIFSEARQNQPKGAGAHAK